MTWQLGRRDEEDHQRQSDYRGAHYRVARDLLVRTSGQRHVLTVHHADRRV